LDKVLYFFDLIFLVGKLLGKIPAKCFAVRPKTEPGRRPWRWSDWLSGSSPSVWSR